MLIVMLFRDCALRRCHQLKLDHAGRVRVVDRASINVRLTVICALVAVDVGGVYAIARVGAAGGVVGRGARRRGAGPRGSRGARGSRSLDVRVVERAGRGEVVVAAPERGRPEGELLAAERRLV